VLACWDSSSYERRRRNYNVLETLARKSALTRESPTLDASVRKMKSIEERDFLCFAKTLKPVASLA
jgi:hypothetical protein